MTASGTGPTAYHHKVKGKPLGFQRQHVIAVRTQLKATYRADSEKGKSVNAGWAQGYPEARREAVRKHRQRNLTESLARERGAWKKRRAAYSQAWRL
jgi:hypothetical protein